MSAALTHDMTARETMASDRGRAPAAVAPALGWTATVLAVAALFLLVFNAHALSSWLGDKEPTPVVLETRAAADHWTAATAALRLDRPHALIHELWGRRKSVRWPSDASRAQR